MAEGTEMKLKVVDLGCERCYKKIKKLLCKFPEIRDQTFNEKEDTVIIKVVCCSPEKIRTKLICKGGGIITCIEVIPPPPPPQPRQPKPTPTPTPTPPRPVPGYPVVFYPIGVCCKSCYGGRGGGPCPHGCRCDRSYGCRCEFLIEENPTCTIM